MSGDVRGFARYTRAERLEQIRRRLDAGLTQREIAADLGMSLSGVRNVLNDPDGAKQLARRARYRGTCRVCGAKTDGSNGRANAPNLCARHSNEVVHPKVWTREAIIDAIRRFAAEHGRPPTAIDWRRADKERGYPQRTNVYGSKYGKPCSFALWADAIEAAGFPRPRSGHYQFESRERRAAARRKRAA